MRRAVLLALAALAVAPSAQAEARRPARSAAVQDWVGVTLQEIASHRTNPPRAARTLAHVSAATYLAAVFGGSKRDEVISGAAAEVLSFLYPDRADYFESLAGDSSAVSSGRTLGKLLVLRAQRDGADAVWTGTLPSAPGTWVPTPPAFVFPPLEPLAGTWRTWNLRTGSQFRPGPPPEYGSAAWRAEAQRVYDVTRALTPEQTAIALEWADGAGTVTPPGHWNQIALDLVAGRNLSSVEVARIFATLNTAQADAFIACWDAKFTYWTQRPVTVIRAEIDPGWSPLIATPPFPSYVSGHSTTSGAASTVLGHFFPQQRAALDAMADEAAVSRLYGGIHFASDNAAGLELGRKIGREALRGSALLVPPRGYAGTP
jgi:membrane-associated phospholipid phosphatase